MTALITRHALRVMQPTGRGRIVPTASRGAMPDADLDAWPKVPDIASSYLYLASRAAGLVNGAAVPV